MIGPVIVSAVAVVLPMVAGFWLTPGRNNKRIASPAYDDIQSLAVASDVKAPRETPLGIFVVLGVKR